MCYTMPRFEEPGFLPLDKAVYGASFSSMDALIFVGACGIAVREIAPYVKSKKPTRRWFASTRRGGL